MGKEELMQFVRAAKGIKMPKEDMKTLVEGSQIHHPLVNLEEEMTREFYQELTPGRIAIFLAKLRGEKEGGPTEDLFKIGTAINIFIGKRDRTKEPTDADMEIILLAIKLIENSLYSGKIKLLSPDDLAALTYILSRLAKIRVFRENNSAYDLTQISGLLTRIRMFAKDYISKMPDKKFAEEVKSTFEQSFNAAREQLQGSRMRHYLYLLKVCLIALHTRQIRQTKKLGGFEPERYMEKRNREVIYVFKNISDEVLVTLHYNNSLKPFCVFMAEYLRRAKSRKQ